MKRPSKLRVFLFAALALLLAVYFLRERSGPVISPGSTLVLEIEGDYVEAPQASLAVGQSFIMTGTYTVPTVNPPGSVANTVTVTAEGATRFNSIINWFEIVRILQLHCDSIEYTPTKKEIKSAEEITPETKTRQTTCQWLWDSTVVNWDGSLSTCCGVFEKSWDFETCYNEKTGGKLTLHQAWNSPLYILARKLVAASMKKSPGLASLVRQADQENLICRNCIRFGFLEE